MAAEPLENSQNPAFGDEPEQGLNMNEGVLENQLQDRFKMWQDDEDVPDGSTAAASTATPTQDTLQRETRSPSDQLQEPPPRWNPHGLDDSEGEDDRDNIHDSEDDVDISDGDADHQTSSLLGSGTNEVSGSISGLKSRRVGSWQTDGATSPEKEDRFRDAAAAALGIDPSQGIVRAYFSGFCARMKRGLVFLLIASVLTFLIFRYGTPFINKFSLYDEVCTPTGPVRKVSLPGSTGTSEDMWTHLVPVRCVQQKMVFGYFNSLAAFYEGDLDIYTGYMWSSGSEPNEATSLYRYGPSIYYGRLNRGLFDGPGVLYSELTGTTLLTDFNHATTPKASESSAVLAAIQQARVHPVQKESLRSAIMRTVQHQTEQKILHDMLFNPSTKARKPQTGLVHPQLAFFVQPHYTPPTSQEKLAKPFEPTQSSNPNGTLADESAMLFAPLPASHGQTIRVSLSDPAAELRGWMFSAESTRENGAPVGTVFIRAPAMLPPSQPLIPIALGDTNRGTINRTHIEVGRQKLSTAQYVFDVVAAHSLPADLRRDVDPAARHHGNDVVLEQKLLPPPPNNESKATQYENQLAVLQTQVMRVASASRLSSAVSSPLVHHAFITGEHGHQGAAADRAFPLPRRLVYEPEHVVLARERAFKQARKADPAVSADLRSSDLLDCSILTTMDRKGIISGSLRAQISIPLNFLLRGPPTQDDYAREAYTALGGKSLRQLLWSILWSTSPDLARSTESGLGLLSSFSLELVWEGQGTGQPRGDFTALEFKNPIPEGETDGRDTVSQRPGTELNTCPDMRSLFTLSSHGDSEHIPKADDDQDRPEERDDLSDEISYTTSSQTQPRSVTPQQWEGSLSLVSFALRQRALPVPMANLVNAPRRFLDDPEDADEQAGRKLAENAASLSLQRLTELSPTLNAYSSTFVRNEDRLEQILATWIERYGEQTHGSAIQRITDDEIRKLTQIHSNLRDHFQAAGLEAPQNITISEAKFLIELQKALMPVVAAAASAVPRQFACPATDGDADVCSVRSSSNFWDLVDEADTETEEHLTLYKRRKRAMRQVTRNASQIAWRMLQATLSRSLRLRTHVLSHSVNAQELSKRRWPVPVPVLARCRAEIMSKALPGN